MAADLSLLHPAFRSLIEQVIAAAAEQGLVLVPMSGARDHDEQQRLYDQGRTAPGAIVTNARPGQSLHNYGMALDLVPQQLIDTANWSPESDLWQTVGALASEFGLEWGGNWTGFVDRPHVQMGGTGGWQALQALPVDEQGFVILDGVPVPAGAVSAPQTTPNSAPQAVPAPFPAPEREPTPFADALLAVGGSIQPQQAGNRVASTDSPRLAAADFADQSRDRLSQMQATFMPAPEVASATPEQPFRPFSQPLGAQGQPADPFRMLFGPAKAAPLGGGQRIRA